MSIKADFCRVGWWLFVPCVLVTFVPPFNVEAAGSNESARLDCGVNALFILFHLEGRPVAIDRILSVLPPAHPQGLSMAELISAARTLGMDLEGVRFGKGARALDRPAIAFVKTVVGGHYAVLRPVGTTGTMVQVLDPPQAPQIGDYDRVLSSKSWTGRILVRRDRWIIRNEGAMLVALAGFVLLIGSFTFGKRTVMAVWSLWVRPKRRCRA